MEVTLDVPGLWRTFGRHTEIMLSAGPAPRGAATAGSFVALSGAPYFDLNQAALFGDADRRTAQAVVEMVLEADLPCLVGVSSTVRDDVSGYFLDGGFEATPEREAMFHALAIPAAAPHAFQVRRVTSDEGHVGAQLILAEAHGYTDPLEITTHGLALLSRSDVGCWVAWDGGDPVSCVFVTRIDRCLGVFGLTTPPRHRRRGAARAVLTQALSDASGWGDPADAIVFWATPAGRPLYESMGFAVVDDIDVWTLGATPEALAAFGIG